MNTVDLSRTREEVLPPLSGLPPGAHALVVEDPARERGSQSAIRSGLRSLGLDVYRAPVDLLILEVGPTAGWALFEWFASVRAQHPDLLLVVVTDGNDADIEQRCDALGAFACLTEPVSLRTLRRCIERTFAFRRQQQEIERLKRCLAEAQATTGTGASAGRHETEHCVEDVWFAIFEQLQAAIPRTSSPAAHAGPS
ncbi:MAG: hypothetical protein PVJ57_22980 [Phycisphaerae bacterium]